MAITHVTLTARTRTGPQVAQRAVQYLLREGPAARTPDIATQRDSKAPLRTPGRVRQRDDLVWQQVGNLPAWAAGSAAQFFTAAATWERSNGRWGMALQAALPRELTRTQQLALTQDFLQAHFAHTPYLAVLHEPRTPTGDPQPHIHVLFSERQLDGIARTPQQFFRRANREHPERGGAGKDRFWSARRCPGRLRQAWVDLSNYHLERAGQEVRLDARSLHARGLERDAERKAGWRGHDGEMYRAHTQEARTETAAREQQLAQAHWAQRKAVLQLTHVHEVSPETMQTMSRAWVRAGVPGRAITPPSLEQLRTQQETVQHTVLAGEQVLARLHTTVQQTAQRERTHTIPSWDEVRQTAAVLEQAVSLGLLDDVPQRGVALHRGWDRQHPDHHHGRGVHR